MPRGLPLGNHNGFTSVYGSNFFTKKRETGGKKREGGREERDKIKSINASPTEPETDVDSLSTEESTSTTNIPVKWSLVLVEITVEGERDRSLVKRARYNFANRR